MNITLYKDTFSKDFWNVDPKAVAQGILSGKWKDIVENLPATDTKEYKQAKTLLPAVTWSGTFKERMAAHIDTYSGLLVLDIDNLEEAVLQNTIAQLSNDEYVRFAFKSPSRKGLKIVVAINTGAEHHLAAFLHLQKTFEEKYLLKIDNSGKDICRLCYVSYDPFCIINEQSKVFEVDTRYGQVKELAQRTDFKNYRPMTDPVKIWELCGKWMEKGGLAYAQGQRNRYVHAMACAMNRCGVNMDDTVGILQQNYSDLESKEVFLCCKSAYFHNLGEHGYYEVKDLDNHAFKAPAYISNYTDDVVANDLMRITAMLHHHNVPMKDIGYTVARIAKCYKLEGFIDLDRASLAELMNKALKMLQEKVAEASSANTLKYETAEDIGIRLVAQDFMAGIIPTYVGNLDRDMGGGLRPKSFYGIIGLGGTFKSIFLEYMCYANAANGTPCLYLNGEMSDMQFYERLAAMVFGINLQYEMSQKRLTQENIGTFIESMKEALGNNIFVVNGNGFNEQNVLATIDNIKATTGKTVRLIAIDGVTQMDNAGKEEIPAAIYNTGVCKEIAKNCNGGEGAVVLGLMHLSGEQNKTFRDTGLRCRGGIKTTANMDGYFATSMLVDPETNALENDDDIIYIANKFYLRLVDKRTRTGVINNIVNVDERTLKLKTEDCNVNDYEVKINKKAKQQS